MISAQCSECQSEEVRPSAGKRRECIQPPSRGTLRLLGAYVDICRDVLLNVMSPLIGIAQF